MRQRIKRQKIHKKKAQQLVVGLNANIYVTMYFLTPVDAFADLWYNQTAKGKKERVHVGMENEENITNNVPNLGFNTL